MISLYFTSWTKYCLPIAVCCHWIGWQPVLYSVLFYLVSELSLNNWCYFVVAGKSNFKSSISLSPTYFSLSHLQQFDLKTFYLLQKFLIRKLVFLQCQIPEKLETPTKHVSCKIINCCSHLLCLLYLLYFVYFILRDLDNIYQSLCISSFSLHWKKWWWLQG